MWVLRMATDEIKEEKKTLKHVCLDCLQGFKSNQGLVSHKTASARNGYCNTANKRKGACYQNSSKYEKYITENNECTFCGSRYKHRRSAMTHVKNRLATGDCKRKRTCECRWCGEIFESDSLLKKHRKECADNYFDEEPIKWRKTKKDIELLQIDFAECT